MNIAQLTDVLLYCTLINYIILLIWFFVFIFAKSAIKKLHTQWFKLSDQNFDAIHYSAMAVYKIGILLLNLVPLIALKLL